MASSAKTETYCVTFEVRVSPGDFPEIERRMECIRQVYNTSLGRCLKLWRGIKADPVWRATLRELQALNRKAKLSEDESLQLKKLRTDIKKIERDAGLSEYGLIVYQLNAYRRFNSPLGSHEAQKAATFAWRTFGRLRFGNARRVHFKRRDAFITVENSSIARASLCNASIRSGSRRASTTIRPASARRSASATGGGSSPGSRCKETCTRPSSLLT